MKHITVPLLVVLLISCAGHAPAPKNYYILEYFEHTEKAALFQDVPLDYSVQVNDVRIPNTYNRKEIVIRHFGPRITYSENDIWAVDLTEIIPSLVVKRLSRYGIFRQVSREFLSARPDYEIQAKINNIEVYESEDLTASRLNIDFALQKVGAKEITVEHSVNREVVLPDDQMETYVQVINETILEETDKFLFKVVQHFKGVGEAPKDTLLAALDSVFIDSVEGGSLGMGILFFPAVSETDNELPYKIIDKDGVESFGIPGKGMPLNAGIYSIKYGSGGANQLLKKDSIEIIPRYKTILKPDWSCLVVDIIDERREVAKVRYELFSSETGESYGTHIPVDREYGEQQKIWILKPGRYKITINSEPFNTYRDFSTVYLGEGQFQKLTLVMGTNEDGTPTNLIGGGVLEENEIAGQTGHWRFLNAVFGNANYIGDNEKGRDQHETTIVLNTQFENKITYDNFPLNYTLRNLIEWGTTQDSETGAVFRVSNDNFYFRNTMVVYFLKNIGLYGRFDVESHMLNEYQYFNDPINFKKRNLNGEFIESGKNVTRVQIKSGFKPMTLKEGGGLNLRAFNTGRANLNIRVGLGIRQDYYDGVYLLSDDIDTEGLDTYKIWNAQNSFNKRGTEVSIVGNFQLPFNLTYYTNADFLIPFEDGVTTTIDWENVFNIKVFKYISIDDRIRFRNKVDENNKDYLEYRHALFLRLTYFLR
ncbi:MAG: PqiC family protein [Candidatus Marinimicrobia bacterium]|nr:PqiC family protein [Candidatus Neomarinimicrobiota bacterium]